MDEKEMIYQTIKKTLELLEKLPEDRRLFYNTGVIMVEVTREEARELLEEQIEELRGNTDNS